MYLNFNIFTQNAFGTDRLIATYDVFEYIKLTVSFNNILWLIATYDVFEFKRLFFSYLISPRLIATYDVFELLGIK